MAYQRPFLISMRKSDPNQPWGFRTFGGKEYGEPHVVEKVLEDSNAEKCGLREGDEIIQIGRINVQDMTFGQVQEILARCGNKIEMFVIREDLLSPRKGKEPQFVKAVVHNPYNSPLNLYSTENIAETLAKQTEVLTEGHIAEEEEQGPENLSFKEKSAVFQLLEDQARQESANQYSYKGSHQRKAAPPPPTKSKPLAVQSYQNKENYTPIEQQERIQSFTTSYSQAQPEPYTFAQTGYYTQTNPGQRRNEEQKLVNYSLQSEKNISTVTNHYPVSNNYTSTEQRSTYKVTPTPPPKTHISTKQSTMATVYGQQAQFYNKQYIEEQESNYQRQQQWQQQQEIQRQQQLAQQQQRILQQQQQQQQRTQPQPCQTQSPQQQKEPVFETVSQPSGVPITYKAPPTQKHRVNWPPPSPTQQNGVWNSPSPTPASPSRSNIEGVWPPKQSTVKDVPKTGFNPSAIREQGTGRRCVWPPPKPDDEFRSGRTTPQSPVSGRRIIFNPSPSPPPVRRSPFGSMSPASRRKDIVWPPPPPTVEKTQVFQQRPSPTFTRKARFDDYIKQHASSNVPSTYKPPPGTQHVEYS